MDSSSCNCGAKGASVKADGRTEGAAGRGGRVVCGPPDGRVEWGEYNSDEAAAPPVEMGGKSSSGTSFPHHEGLTLTSAVGEKNPPMVIPANFRAG